MQRLETTYRGHEQRKKNGKSYSPVLNIAKAIVLESYVLPLLRVSGQMYPADADLLAVVGVGAVLAVKVLVADAVRGRVYFRVDLLCEEGHLGYFF